MEPDLTPAVYDGLGIGHGTAGRLLEGPEQFILADNYSIGHDDVPETLPVFLHVGSGRRFTIQVQEVFSDTPGDPTATPEIQSETPAPQAPAPQAPGFPDILQPSPEEAEQTANSDEQQARPTDAIQAPMHLPQPEQPQSNVPPDFELKVKERDEQLQPGAPLPTPDE